MKPVKKDIKAAAPETPISKKPYHLDGKKNMPTAVPGKVEKTTLEKEPLPMIEKAPPAVPPTPNEKIIDKSLEEHIAEPDLKKIATTTPAPVGTPAVKAPVVPAVPEVKPQLISMEYKPTISDIQADQKTIVDTNVLPKLKAEASSRLQILSYASASKDGQSSARRISLARGLSLRGYLLEKGVEPGRIDIRALGDNTEEKPLDRIDLLVIKSK